MSSQTHKCAIVGLRWSVSVVVIIESVRLLYSKLAIHQFAETGHAPWIRLALATAEIGGAVLFLIPALSFVGGATLIGVFTFAFLLHVLHSQFYVGNLITYGMAVLVCMTHQKK
jgi:hypothetical protein